MIAATIFIAGRCVIAYLPKNSALLAEARATKVVIEEVES
jgi:hypothetical protein